MKKEAVLYKQLPNKKVLCTACIHMCQIEEGKYWECGVGKT